MPDYEKISKDIHERFKDAFDKLYVSELKDQIADKDEMITALNHTIAELQSRLPKEMQDCTIVFEECPVGHGSLRGTNWIKTECPWCQITKLKADLEYADQHAARTEKFLWEVIEAYKKLVEEKNE